MARKLDISVVNPPFGIRASKFIDGVVRISIKTRGGEELYVELPCAAAEALSNDLTAALSSEAAS